MGRIGFFTATTGVISNQMGMDITGNNLANVNTVGYKKGALRFKDVMQSAVYSQEGSILRNNSNRYSPTSIFNFNHGF